MKLSFGCDRSTRSSRPALGLFLLFFAPHDAAGQEQLWIDQLGSSAFEQGIAVAPLGEAGLCVVGSTNGSMGGQNAGNWDAWFSRYDSDGNQLWIRQLGTPESEYGQAADSDGSEGLFVGGSAFGELGSPQAGGGDAWLAHYDHVGHQRWIRQFGSKDYDVAVDVAPDGSGGGFVAGVTSGDIGGPNAGQYDAWFARFDEQGNFPWIRQVGTTGIDDLNAILSDGGGGMYVVGGTSGDLGGPNAGDLDAWLARFDGTGSQLWMIQFGTSGQEMGQALAPDDEGGVYVSGYTSGSLGGPTSGFHDVWVARFDQRGSRIWIRQWGTTRADVALAASADEVGGVYVSGSTEGGLGGPHAGLRDAWLAHCDGDGGLSWIQQLGSTAEDEILSSAPDLAGGVYVAGYTSGSLSGPNAGFDDAWLARYDGSCNSGTTYCVASSTSIPGCTASLSATGSPTLSDPTAWTVSSGPVPGGNLGLLLFGSSGPDNTPYGTLGGQLCVASPTFRTAPKTSCGDQGQCNGNFSFTLADLIAATPIVTTGATINAQVWARDPANADGFLLSDGLEVVVCP